jgi:hypothetical protein
VLWLVSGLAVKEMMQRSKVTRRSGSYGILIGGQMISLQLDVGRPDHFAHRLAEVGGRSAKRLILAWRADWRKLTGF